MIGTTHATCHHKKYRLSCHDYDGLLADCAGLCQVCDIDGGATPHGALHIDHDPRMGPWAVRGLLCSRCNTSLHREGTLPRERVEHYLANPWYLRQMDQAGRRDRLPEPPIGALVRAGTFRYKREQGGWRASGRWRGLHCISWAQLNVRHGPHRVEILSPAGIPQERVAEAARVSRETVRKWQDQTPAKEPS